MRLRILDVQGRTLREESFQAEGPGDREWVWDGRARGGRPAAAGVYWAEVRQGTGSARVRLGLLR